jgi:hypothetical protein
VNEAPPRSHKESSVNSDSTTRTSRKGTQTLRSTRTRSGSSVVTTEDAPTPEQAATTTIPIHSRATRSRSKSNNPISETTQKGTPSESVQNGKKILPAPSASTDGQNAFNSLLEVLQDAFDELSQKKKPPTKTQILNKIYFGNKFPNYRAGPGAHRVPVEEVFHFNAARLLQVLDKKKYSGSEIYTYIQQLAKTKFEPVALGPDKFPFLIVPRKSKPFYPRTATNQVIDTASALVDDDSEAHDDIPETPRMGKSTSFRRAGKSTLRPATSTKKRHHSDIESDSESPLAREAKKSHYFSDNDESNDKNVDESDEGESSFASVDPIRLVIRADKIPSTVPRGPDNAWTCDEEDCDYMVRGGDEEDCKARISEHFHAHEQQHNRVQLAMTEGTRGHLPVKYVYFPPFLITVVFQQPPTLQHASSEADAAVRISQAAHDSRSLRSSRSRYSIETSHSSQGISEASSSPAAPQNSHPAPTGSFRRHLNQFRRRAHPISDNIHLLTLPSQPPARKTQEARGSVHPGGTAHNRRDDPPPANQAESDSLTEPDESSPGHRGESPDNNENDTPD